MTAESLIPVFNEVRQSMQAKLVGHEKLIDRLLIAAITGGHMLVEGSPGLAKTYTVNCFARLLDASFARIQATPDLLPADMTGTSVYRQNTGEFNFVRGPLFNNIVLVDEINRAPPKVQSALLEAMGEKQISAAGTTHKLEQPFMVVATQNPIEHEGTYPLPEAQLDRFMFFTELALPTPELEKEILDLVLNGTTNAPLTPKLHPAHLEKAAVAVTSVHLSDAVKDYIVRLTTATRGHGAAGDNAQHIEHAASPRGSIYLAMAARAQAWLQERDHVTPEDVAELAGDVLCGRMVLSYQAQAEGLSGRQLISNILNRTAVL